MNENDHIALKLFDYVPIERFALLGHLNKLTEGIGIEINRSSQNPFEEIPEFRITWGDARDFRAGYLKGLGDTREGLANLYQNISNPKKASTDYAYGEIQSWAKEWQVSHKHFDFSRTEVFAVSETGDEVKILTDVRAILLSDGKPSDRDIWLEVDMLGLSPVETLFEELWSKLAYENFGIGFFRGGHSVGPSDAEQELYSFDVEKLCDEHWQELVEFNSKCLERAGLSIEIS